MAESDAVRISREYREQLVRNEDAALKRMSRLWAKMERETMDNYMLLAQEVKDLQMSGQSVPIQMIYTLERHRKMLEQLNVLVPQYEHQSLEIIEQTQRANYTLGLESANAIIQASHPSDDMWTRIHQEAAEAMAGYAGNGAPLAELLKTDYGAMAGRITDALVSGIGLGKGYKQVAKDMRDAAGVDFKRSVLIARTETNRAYRQANADQYRRSGVVEKVLRLCAMSGSCAACIIMDGWECRDGICDDHPNGKCTTVVVTTGGIVPQWEHGADWLEHQSPADQRAILGEGRYELYKQGVPLSEMVTMKENPVWGGNPTMKTLNDLKMKYPQVKTSFSIPNKNVAQQATPQSYLSDTFTKDLKDISFLACKDLAKAETQDQIITVLGGGDQTKGSCASVALAYAGRSNGIDVRDFRDGKSREWFSSKINKRNMASECGITHETINDFSKTGWEKLKSANMEDGVDYLLGYACHMAVIHKNGNAFEYLELQSNYNNGWQKLNAGMLKSRFGASDSGRYYALDIYDVRTCTGNKFKELLGYLNTEPGNEKKGKGGSIK